MALWRALRGEEADNSGCWLHPAGCGPWSACIPPSIGSNVHMAWGSRAPCRPSFRATGLRSGCPETSSNCTRLGCLKPLMPVTSPSRPTVRSHLACSRAHITQGQRGADARNLRNSFCKPIQNILRNTCMPAHPWSGVAAQTRGVTGAPVAAKPRKWYLTRMSRSRPKICCVECVLLSDDGGVVLRADVSHSCKSPTIVRGLRLLHAWWEACARSWPRCEIRKYMNRANPRPTAPRSYLASAPAPRTGQMPDERPWPAWH